jgi:hypothetical protein
MFDYSAIQPELFSSDEHRALKIIDTYIKKLCLDLSGYSVLTEVGSNNYLYTPLIASLAGAKNVFAWTADTRFGKGVHIVERCADLAQRLGVLERIEFSINNRNMTHVKLANIVTNSGFIRPIDREFVVHINASKCVVPLMYEAWEHRSSDLDLVACREESVQVAGTWENHPDLEIFNGTGQLAVKLVMEAGFEVYRNNIAVWSSDEFGSVAKKAFESAGASSVKVLSEKRKLFELLPSLDVVYFCDYFGSSLLVGDDGVLSFTDIRTFNPALGIVHLFGNVDVKTCQANGINIYPKQNGSEKQMTVTLAYLGPEPVLSLNVAGFKVGQTLLAGNKNSLCQPLN